MTAARREMAPCPDCDGYGHVACCIAWEVEGIGGPRGCRCGRPGMRECSRCWGTGEVAEVVDVDPETGEEVRA